MKTYALIAGVLLTLLPVTSVVRAEDDLHVIYQEGRAAFYAGQLELAREKLSLVMAKNPGHAPTRAMLAQIERQIGAENVLLRKTYEKVIIEKFEVSDAELDEAIQALRILSGKATGGKIIPNIIMRDPAIGKKHVTLSLAKIPLCEVLHYLAQLSGARLAYEKNAVMFSNPSDVAVTEKKS